MIFERKVESADRDRCGKKRFLDDLYIEMADDRLQDPPWTPSCMYAIHTCHGVLVYITEELFSPYAIPFLRILKNALSRGGRGGVCYIAAFDQVSPSRLRGR